MEELYCIPSRSWNTLAPALSVRITSPLEPEEAELFYRNYAGAAIVDGSRRSKNLHWLFEENASIQKALIELEMP